MFSIWVTHNVTHIFENQMDSEFFISVNHKFHLFFRRYYYGPNSWRVLEYLSNFPLIWKILIRGIEKHKINMKQRSLMVVICCFSTSPAEILQMKGEFFKKFWARIQSEKLAEKNSDRKSRWGCLFKFNSTYARPSSFSPSD